VGFTHVLQKFPRNPFQYTHFDFCIFIVKRDELRLLAVKLRERPRTVITGYLHEEQREG